MTPTPDVTTADSEERDVEPCDDCRWELNGEPCSFHADAALRAALASPAPTEATT